MPRACLLADWVALHPVEVDRAVANLVEEFPPQQLTNQRHGRLTVFLLCAENLQTRGRWRVVTVMTPRALLAVVIPHVAEYRKLVLTSTCAQWSAR